jgi:hypothetical protein
VVLIHDIDDVSVLHQVNHKEGRDVIPGAADLGEASGHVLIYFIGNYRDL